MKISVNKAQIGYSYDDSGGGAGSMKSGSTVGQRKRSPSPAPLDEEEEDLDIQVDVRLLTADHKHILNKSALEYGMEYGDFVRMLTLDHEEKEDIKRNKLLEAEKAQYSVSVTQTKTFSNYNENEF